MITANLKLRYSAHALREAKAWFIAGGDPALWLGEVTRWNVDQASLRLWPLPVSAADRTSSGVLVTLTKGNLPSTVSQRCVPFGSIAGQLYLPVEAWLDPDLSDAELQAEFSSGKRYVWHPAIGLVAFEPDDAVELAELIAMPAPLARRWDVARPGVALAPRLTTILPVEKPSLEMILEESQGDIGTASDQLFDLPPSDLEPKPGILNQVGRHGMRMLARMLQWLTQHVPGTSDQQSWVNKLENWATQKLANFHAGLDAERNKELLRLMDLLESDPDRGLRFALPLHGDAHRGIAPPGGRLVERPTNFSLNQIGGGTAADVWDVSYDHRRQLTMRYRELANREMNLGRHRRAAYIFAELLGDFHAAAGALTEGRHWREAAVLYQKRLNRPQDAVRCLESGGLWNEAIELYLELQEFEKAGDLYLRLDQIDAAHLQYREAVSRAHSKGDHLTAAQLLEKKLAAADEAVDELTSGWPHSSQAEQCLRESFQLLGRLGRHQAAGQRLIQLREDSLPAQNRLRLVNIVADTALQYPDRNVQATAADCTRVLVAGQLKTASQGAAAQLLSAITRLVPADRLLNRDCQRYLHRPEITTSAPPRPQSMLRRKPTSPGKCPRLVRTLQLPKAVCWEAAISTGDMIVAAGHHNQFFVTARGSFTELEKEGKISRPLAAEPDAPLIMAAASLRQEFVLLHPLGGELLPEYEFQPTDACPFVTRAGALRGMSPQILAAAGTSHGIMWLLEVRNHELTLIAIGEKGQQLSTETITLPEVSPEFSDTPCAMPIPFHARAETLYIGYYNRLLIYDKAKPLKTIDFAQPITSLVGSAPFTLTRIVATFARGGVVLWDDIEGEHSESFGEKLVKPIACITRQGYLIAASGNVAEVYQTRGKELHYESEFTLPGSNTIAVVASSQSNEFGVVLEDGTIAVYELD